MIVRRALTVGGLVAVFAIAATGPALADDLAGYLDDASDAVYSGSRVVATTWDGIESIGIVEVQHLGGMATVDSGSSNVMVGEGRLRLAGQNKAALSFVGVTQFDLDARYIVSTGEATEHLGRSARILEVTEDGFLRMKVVVDNSTSAPVATEVYAGDGSIFRYSTMIQFSVSVDPNIAMTDEHPYEMMLPVEEAGLPVDAAGYQLVDVYAGPQGANQAF